MDDLDWLLSIAPGYESRTKARPYVRELAALSCETGCVDWPYALLDYRVPVVILRSRQTVRVSHLILELRGEPRTEERPMALHSCDRPICVAWWHLRWGTDQDNKNDMWARGRAKPHGHDQAGPGVYRSVLHGAS